MPEPGTSVQPYDLPEDIRRELLNAQKGMIVNRQKLPIVKMMPAGVGMYEFTDTGDTVREFAGIILGSHARNVLWDKPYGQQASAGEEEKGRPACMSSDGKTGVPRQGFRHAALQGREALGTERIVCRTCPYNQWGSKGLIPAILRPGETAETAKGKAVVNQRSVIILTPNRVAPVELILPPTSIVGLDEYLTTTLNQGRPVQSLVTIFKQEQKQKGTLKWSQAVFVAGDSIDAQTFQRVLQSRTEYKAAIEGIEEELIVEAEPEVAPAASGTGEAFEDFPAAGGSGEDDQIPF
jgi:hypothetical protein